MMIMINDSQDIYGNDLLKTGIYIWLKFKHTIDSQMVGCNVIQLISSGYKNVFTAILHISPQA